MPSCLVEAMLIWLYSCSWGELVQGHPILCGMWACRRLLQLPLSLQPLLSKQPLPRQRHQLLRPQPLRHGTPP